MSRHDRSEPEGVMRMPRARWPARRSARIAAVAAALLGLAPGAALAEPSCVPGSIGPRGCDSIRPGDALTERPGVPLLDPDLEFDPTIELGSRRPSDFEGALAADPGVLRLDPGAPRGPVVGRDPRAVQSFQTPYSFD